MNKRIIFYILSLVLLIEGAAMQISSVTALIYKESDGFYFLFIGLAMMIIGGLCVIKKPTKTSMTPRDGFAATALSWVLLSLCGCLPFWISGAIPSFADALFETVSGFTTTGASILNNVEGLSHCMLMWRSFSNWLGGMGVLVFLLAIIPSVAGHQNMYLMKAESPGPMVNKLMPKLRFTAALLYIIYIALTIIEIAALLIAQMPVFDAINTSLATAGTGGFSVKNASMGDYTVAQQLIIGIFMVLFATNFAFYFFLLAKKFKQAFMIEEVRWYIGIVVFSTLAIALNLFLCGTYDSVGDALHQSFFQVASISSSTGFSSTDYNTWPEFSKAILFIIMCIGACAGSTGGGFKVSRLIILLKESVKEFLIMLHPHNVKSIKLDGKAVKHETVRSVSIFFIVYMVISIVSFLIISFDNFDFTTNITAVAATINNTGPGLSVVGPTGNFSQFSNLSKIVLCFNMLAGRLELFPLLIIFFPQAWKKR